MALRQEGNYWYGESVADVWDYFVWWTRNSPEPVRHHRQAVCPCGCGVFTVVMDSEDPSAYQSRTCVGCGTETVMFQEGRRPRTPGPNAGIVECACLMEEFEVVGVTVPFGGDPDSARTFYLGLRCVDCGCLGCYADWNPRYNDAAAYLGLM